jgi:hypothetical protein
VKRNLWRSGNSEFANRVRREAITMIWAKKKKKKKKKKKEDAKKGIRITI